jgi:hypothetical protein
VQQTDVKASRRLAVTGVFQDALGQTIKRCRIKALYAAGAAAGSVIITDGSATGLPLIAIDVPAGGAPYMLLPGEGVLCENGPYGTVAGVASATIFYG